MLVLTRKLNEKVILTVPPQTGPVRVELMIADVRVRGTVTKVRVGFVAPKDVMINREEIQVIIDQEQERGSQR